MTLERHSKTPNENPNYWICNCISVYCHRAQEKTCQVCQARRDEQPLALNYEVEQHTCPSCGSFNQIKQGYNERDRWYRYCDKCGQNMEEQGIPMQLSPNRN